MRASEHVVQNEPGFILLNAKASSGKSSIENMQQYFSYSDISCYQCYFGACSGEQGTRSAVQVINLLTWFLTVKRWLEDKDEAA